MEPINQMQAGSPEQARENPEAVNSIPQTSQIPESPKNNNTITVVSMAIFVLLALGAVAFLYYQNQQLKGMLASYQTIPTPTSSATALATADPTENWKTYTNSKANYSFKYPEMWVDKTSDNDRDVGSFTIDIDGTEKMLGVIFSGEPDLENDKKNGGASKSFVISSNKYLFITYVECQGPGCGMGSKQLDIFNQVLSTFKFTEATKTATQSATPKASISPTPAY